MNTMNSMEAWKWIISNWNCPSWKGVPDWVRSILGLDPRLGMCHGCLVTQYAAKGMNEFINRMNSKRGG